MSRAQLKETSTTSLPEQRIWVVKIYDEGRELDFTFLKKSFARAFKTLWDEAQPELTILRA